MKTSVAKTSIDNYHSNIKGPHEDGEDQMILNALKSIQPATGRMLQRFLNFKIENSSIARSLNNLKRDKKIISPFSDKCPVTGVTVQFYTVIEEGQATMF